MIDTVSCSEEADLTEKFFEKLLLGAIDRVEDQTDVRPASGGQPEITHFEPPQHAFLTHRPKHATIPHIGSGPVDENYTHQPFKPGPSRTQAQREAQVSNMPPAAFTPRYAPQPGGYEPQFEPTQPRRQTTVPPGVAELPMQQAQRMGTFGPSKPTSKGWRPGS